MSIEIWIGIGVGLIPSFFAVIGFFMSHNSRISVLEKQYLALEKRIETETADRKELSQSLNSLSHAISKLEGYLEKIMSRKTRSSSVSF
jgi:hypothetical protein